MKVLVAQLCPTRCNPVDCSPPGPSVHGILQARILEWLALPFSTGACIIGYSCVWKPLGKPLGMEEILAVKFQINLNLIFVPGSQILRTNRIWEITKEKRIGESCELASNFPHCVFPYENMCSPWVSKCLTRLSN